MSDGLKRSDFFYDLPPRLIAQSPAPERTDARLMVLDRFAGAVRHRRFADIPSFFSPGDCLVINDSRVIPARLRGVDRKGAAVEFLLHERMDESHWEVLAKPGKRARPGDEIIFGGDLRAHIEAVAEDGLRVAAFDFTGDFDSLLERCGETPLPPYIQAQSKNETADRMRYQTVYATHNGSAAAPTAGLHFTETLLNELTDRGVRLARVTLHVGLGTFRPVRTDNIAEHRMHQEYYRLLPEDAAAINETKRNNGQVVAVGTTSCRTLESSADGQGIVRPGAGRTSIFIYPGYRFRITDGLITNFHLPESTLIMLVSAFAGRERVLAAYREAIEQEYRFFSYGDAMLIKSFGAQQAH